MEANAITIEVVSTETIKPQLQDLKNVQPFKICLLDQIVPVLYIPFIFFYNNDQNAPAGFSDRLKTSLSSALTRFYPFSGRLDKDNNLFITDFHAGVPFKEARVINCHVSLSDFLTGTMIMPSLNQFLPLRPFHVQKPTPDAPQLAVQLTRFPCGGFAVGACFCHRIADAATSAAFLNGWASVARGESSSSSAVDLDRYLDLHGAARRFPAVDSLSERVSYMLFVSKARVCGLRTERFVFNEVALAKLKSRARSEAVPNPTRVQAVSAFIWQSAMAAAGTSSSPSVMSQAVNIRPRGPTTRTAMGNILMSANVVHDTEKPSGLSALVELVNESMSKVNNDRMRSIRGAEAFDLVVGNLNKVEDLPEVVGFSSWVNMGLKDVDFGLGKPIWVGVFGGGSELIKFVVLNDATWCNGIEAFCTLDNKVLEIMKNDPHFLELAVVDPPILV